MLRNLPDGGSPGQRDRRSWQLSEHDARALAIVAVASALALAFASLFPLPLVPFLVSQFLFWGSAVAAFAAVWYAQPILADRLTAWDQAAMLLALSLLASAWIDFAAIAALAESG